MQITDPIADMLTRIRNANNAKCQLLDADTANLSFFRWNGEIYKEYKTYICDSAIHYLRVNLDWAERYASRFSQAAP